MVVLIFASISLSFCFKSCALLVSNLSNLFMSTFKPFEEFIVELGVTVLLCMTVYLPFGDSISASLSSLSDPYPLLSLLSEPQLSFSPTSLLPVTS